MPVNAGLLFSFLGVPAIFLGIRSYITKSRRDRILKMSLNIKQRSRITKLWQKAGGIEPPFINIKKK